LAPSNTALPTITGTAQDGQWLRRSSNGKWSSPDKLTFSYQWQRCDSAGANCADIPGANSTAYKLSSADVTHKVTLVVKATDQEAQSTPATATPLGPVSP
jgi:hypothetical protein